MNELRQIFLLLVFFPLVGCAAQTVLVYESKGEKQCMNNGITMLESKEKLSNKNIEVVDSKCGRRTGVSVMAMCGGPTTSIIIHEIGDADLSKAKELGFENIINLVYKDLGSGYEMHECKSA
mgnify:CR=1 FL=1